MSSMADLEEFVDARAWTRPPKREFFFFFDQWHHCFEAQFATGRPAATGSFAMDEVDARLPADAMLFCEPKYRYLPSGAGHPFFAFIVDGLSRVDRELFNAHDVVLAEKNLSFCCMYIHEEGALADPVFWTPASR